MNISKRLKAVGDLVEANSNIIDVGCDHALLDIYLVQKQMGMKPIASDNKEGPCKRAKDNIKKYHLEDEIQVKLGDGLDTIQEDTDTIIISGMGGQNMIGIFKRHLEVLKHIDTIILSPNNDIYFIRRFIAKHGFYLEKEVLVEDNSIIYTILKFKKGTKSYTKKELFFGPVLLQENNELFQKYWKKEMDRRRITLQLLPKKYVVRCFGLKQEINQIKKVLHRQKTNSKKGSLSNGVGKQSLINELILGE